MKNVKTKVAIGAAVLMACSTALSAGNFKAAADSNTPLTTIGGIVPGAPKNFWNNQGQQWEGLDRMPLAFGKGGAKWNEAWPALAQKWSQNKDGSVVHVTLRSNLHWSDGAPITPYDVEATMELMFAAQSMYFDLGKMTIDGPLDMTFYRAPKSSYNMFEHALLVQDLTPYHVFSKFLPANMWDLINQSTYTGTDSSLKAQAQQAQNQLTDIAKKVEAYAPNQDVSDGPFMITGINPGEAVLSKNPRYYNAKNIHVDQVVIRNYSDNQGIWNYMIGGQVDQATSAMPTSIKQQALKTPGNVFYSVPSYYASSLTFNERDYPYNIPQVRQALAYLIDRNQVQAVGEPVSGMQAKWIDGMVDSATQGYLTNADTAKLNPYKHDTAMATKLLTKAGFKKNGNQWYMPNGQAWKASIAVNSGWSDFVQGASVVANQMTQFGIPTAPQLIPGTTIATDQPAGKYPLSFWIIALGPQPIYAYKRIFGTFDGNYLVAGTVVHKPDAASDWIDTPQAIQVPGYGAVDVGQTTYDLNMTSDPKRLHDDVAKLALAANINVPSITMWNGLQAGFVNTTNYTDFPVNDKQVLIAGAGDYPPIGFWMDMGYIRPKN